MIPGRVPTLDLARFAAAVGVMLYHYSPALTKTPLAGVTGVTQFGYLGVPLFFMISGFVIANSAMNRSAFEFAISRFVRLFPAYWAGMAVTILIVTLLGTGSFTVGQVLANLTMLNDYADIPSIDAVYWTLHVELKFYGCVFLLCLFGQFHRYRIWLSIWLALLFSYLFMEQPRFLGWFVSPFYSSYFMAGVVFYLWYKQGIDRFLMVILLGSLVLSSVYSFRHIEGFIRHIEADERWTATLIVWCFYALFAAIAVGRLRVTAGPIILLLGGLTYPLYLIHSRAGKDLIDWLSNHVSVLASVGLVSLLVLLTSLAIHLLIERRLANPLKRSLLARLPAWARS